MERESARRPHVATSAMEECCVVCAEPLEWVAIGACGHREVCALCVVRLRFVLKDLCCCFCKQARAPPAIPRGLRAFVA